MSDKKPKLDAAQKEAVDININAVVSAGAGSGKTSVLSKRFTDLLLRDKNCKVEEILTLTFTKKATVEMNGRIYKELASVDKEKVKDFYKANIKTLDSYCSQVARLGAHYYGLSPDFVIDEDTVIEKIRGLSLPFILKNRDNRAIKALVATKDFSEIADQLFTDTILKNSTIAENIDFNKNLELQFELVRSEWKKTCQKLNSLTAELKNQIQAYGGNHNIKFISGLKNILDEECDEIPEVDFNESVSDSRSAFINYFCQFNLIKQTGAPKETAEIKLVHNEIKRKTSELLQLENYIYGNQFVIELIPLLEQFQQIVNETKRRIGMITYADSASLALKILIEHPDIRQIEKEKYRYIMIDEFQDNNSMQRDLLFLLAEKKDRSEKSVPSPSELEKDKLFFVGDEKQSIYKFRGADVSVFRSLAKAFAEGNRELKTNYRSHPALIAGFNTIFGGAKFPDAAKSVEQLPCVFYTENDEKRKSNCGENIADYEAVYRNVEIPLSKIENVLPDEEKKFYEQRIHFALVNKDNSAEDGFYDADRSECYWVVDKIKELLDGKYGKKYSVNDIAVLFKSYSLLPVYERILLREGIPYISETVKGFFADGPVNDIMSFLRITAYPKDKLSFANILRSPFVNLSAAEIRAVLSSVEDNKNLMEQNFSFCLSEDSNERFNYGLEVYNKLKDFSRKETLVKMISYLWYETGYRYETLWNKSVYMYASSYDRLFELARQADLKSTGLSEFVDSIDDYQSESEKLDGMEIPLESTEGVRIMSIHKSKGLEFPVVFVCGNGHAGMHDSNASVSYTSKEYGLTINTPPNPLWGNKMNFFYERQKETEKNIACAELRRVAYVALTRAEERLFITGSYKFSNFDKNDLTPGSDKRADKIIEILLPSISCFVKENKETQEYYIDSENELQSPFTFDTIQYRKKERENGKIIDRNQIINNLKEKYESADVIEKKEPDSIYINPSYLHPDDDETHIPLKTEIIVDKKIPYSRIDELVAESVPAGKKEAEFTYANFGTIAHSYMECAVKDEPPLTLNRELVGLHGNEKKAAEVDAICKDMQKKFLESKIGIEVLAAVKNKKFWRSEFSFKSLVSGKIINGQVDLVYENDGKFTIVDYKTNREMKPDYYYLQLACYRDAVSKMMNVPVDKIKCVLFYLRYGKDVDITSECNTIDLSKTISVAE